MINSITIMVLEYFCVNHALTIFYNTVVHTAAIMLFFIFVEPPGEIKMKELTNATEFCGVN